MTLLALAALFQMADAMQVMALGLLRGMRDTKVPMWSGGGQLLDHRHACQLCAGLSDGLWRGRVVAGAGDRAGLCGGEPDVAVLGAGAEGWRAWLIAGGVHTPGPPWDIYRQKMQILDRV